MNDYAKLIAHAAAKFTGRPAVLSPLLDSYCGWENKKNRFSTEPTKGNFRIILSAGGLSFNELSIDIGLTTKEVNQERDYIVKEGSLKILMQHGSKELGDNNFKWSRNCTYEFPLNRHRSPLEPHFAAYWTYDDFLVIQARDLENPVIRFSDISPFDGEPGEGIENKFRLIPTEVIDVLEPALNVPFMQQTLQAIKKRTNDVFSYFSRATVVPETKDVLLLLTSIQSKEDKKKAYESKKAIDERATAGHSSQEGSGPEESDSKGPEESDSKGPEEADSKVSPPSTRSRSLSQTKKPLK